MGFSWWRRESTWEVIQQSLDGYQPERLATALREYLTPRVPSGVRTLPEPLRKQLRGGVEVILYEHLGPWYHQSGVKLGHERVDGYCWCHSFFNQNPIPDVGVEHNVQLIMKAVGRGHAWLSTLDATFRGVELLDDEDEGIRQMALSDAVVKVIELTADATDTNDDWYPYAFDAVEWLFEARGLRLTPEVRSAMKKTMGVFTSWVGPTEEEARAAGDAVALAAVRTAFDARYPRQG
ncbi:hypothetical protein HPC49_03550 [Pyxidicoccus fallax]|uniref:Uncharacterized protein n=1 Tax=Pyxidicoccus fallax TaxID=394095 RepID=A0A848LPK1_9BACT|nr:hypothetical protein [Pyxidicoccus fallax]NMO19815.1 hypothetical protein [Pyxidicoccus fallax]NPC77332.1 hypothetical protein [Pyxidicoccus fallax]